VFKVEEGPVLVNAVKTAIRHGYRSIDTAAIYGNEEGVGRASKKDLKRRAFHEKTFLSHLKYGMLI
jgi:methylglyoxal/glyoxal reductase